MLRNLPEGSRYYAAMAVDRKNDAPESDERDPRLEEVMDHRVWTMDRRLIAMLINAVNLNTTVSGHWEKPPHFETVGPASWSEEEPKKKLSEQEFTDNFDFFRKMGFPLA